MLELLASLCSDNKSFQPRIPFAERSRSVFCVRCGAGAASRGSGVLSARVVGGGGGVSSLAPVCSAQPIAVCSVERLWQWGSGHHSSSTVRGDERQSSAPHLPSSAPRRGRVAARLPDQTLKIVQPPGGSQREVKANLEKGFKFNNGWSQSSCVPVAGSER